MTCHYVDLSSASDWASRKGSLLQPIRSTILIWLVTRHKHGISVGVPQLSFRGYVGCILRRVKVDYWLIICRQGKKRDGCCCCIKLRDDYTESECGKRDLLQEIMDKYFGRVLLSLPGKVNAFVWYNLKELTTNGAFSASGSLLFGMRMPVCYVFHMIDERVEVSFVQLFFLPLGFFQPIFLPTTPPPYPLPPPPPPSTTSLFFFLYRFIFQCDRCIFCLLYVRGLMAGFRCCASHGGVTSIQGLAAKSGSPWILQAPNLHLVIKVFKLW